MAAQTVETSAGKLVELMAVLLAVLKADLLAAHLVEPSVVTMADWLVDH